MPSSLGGYILPDPGFFLSRLIELGGIALRFAAVKVAYNNNVLVVVTVLVAVVSANCL